MHANCDLNGLKLRGLRMMLFLALQEVMHRGETLTREVLSTGVFDVLLGRGPLQCAARKGDVAALALLLDAGALDAIDACDGSGLTALQECIHHMLSFNIARTYERLESDVRSACHQ